MGPSTVPHPRTGTRQGWFGTGMGVGIRSILTLVPSFPPIRSAHSWWRWGSGWGGHPRWKGWGSEGGGLGWDRLGSLVSDPSPSSSSIHPSIHPLGRGPFTTHVVRHPTHVAPLRAPHLPRASERGWWEVAGRGGEPGKERGGYTQPQPYTHVNQVLAAEPHLSSGRPEAVVETETKPWNTPGGSEVVRNKAKGRTCSPARR